MCLSQREVDQVDRSIVQIESLNCAKGLRCFLREIRSRENVVIRQVNSWRIIDHPARTTPDGLGECGFLVPIGTTPRRKQVGDHPARTSHDELGECGRGFRVPPRAGRPLKDHVEDAPDPLGFAKRGALFRVILPAGLPLLRVAAGAKFRWFEHSKGRGSACRQ